MSIIQCGPRRITNCNGTLKLETAQQLGVGFKIVVKCDICNDRVISSSTYIRHSYEINRRFIFAMRCLEVGMNRAAKFCGLMDMPAFLTQSTYDLITNHIHTCVAIAAEKLLGKACAAEQKAMATSLDMENADELTVSGDGTWKKRGFTSLYGETSLIGYYTGKIIDLVVKSSYCKQCEVWKLKCGTTEYEEWEAEHKDVCAINHQGSSCKI